MWSVTAAALSLPPALGILGAEQRLQASKAAAAAPGPALRLLHQEVRQQALRQARLRWSRCDSKGATAATRACTNCKGTE